MPQEERLDLTSELGRSLLKESATAVANDDVIRAREANIALTEGQGRFDPDDEETQSFEDLPVESTAEYYKEEELVISDKAKAESSLYGALADVEAIDPFNTFNIINDELSLIGDSPTYNQIAEQVREDVRFELSGIIEDTAVLGRIEEVNALVAQAPLLLAERSPVRAKALDNASINQVVKDPSIRGQEYQEWYQSRFEDRIQARRSVNQIFNKYVIDSSSNTFDALQDFAGTLVVSEQLFLSRAAKKVLGEFYFALGGDMKRDMADYILAGAGEREVEQRAEEVASAISESAGFAGTNDLVKVFALETVRDYINQPSSERDWGRMIDNVAGVIGIVPIISEAIIAKTLRSIFNVGKATTAGRSSRVMDEIQEADPELGSKLNAGAIQDEEIARNLNITQGEAAQRALPHGNFQEDVYLEGAPQQLLDDLQGLQTKADEIDDYIENTYLFSDETYTASEKKISDIINNQDIIGIAKPSIATMGRVGNKIDLNLNYGVDTSNYPINTFEKAVELKTLLEKNLSKASKTSVKAEILAKDDVSGLYVKPRATIDSEGVTLFTTPRFYVRVKQEIPMLYSDIKPGPQDVTKPIGRVMTWLMPPNTFVARNVIGAGNISNEKKFFVSNELKAIAQPFLSLKHSSKVKVADLLQTGEEQAKVFKYSKLEGKYSADEIKGYYSTRQFNETVYRIKNNDLRTSLDNDGFKSLQVVLDDAGENIYRNAGKPLTVEEAQLLDVAFNPVNRQQFDLPGSGASKLYEDGFTVVKLKTRFQNGGNHYDHLVVKESDLSDLPTNVMPYRVGYNMRINNNPYFVEEAFDVLLNGVSTRITKVVGVADSPAKAKQWVDDLSNAGPIDKNRKYSFRLDRNISSTESLLKQEYDLLDGSGPQFWYSKRGKRLQDQSDNLSSVQDPVSTIYKLSENVANVVTHKQMFEGTIVAHQKKYGNITVNDKPLWQWSPEMKDYRYIGKEISESAHPIVKAANREYEYIESLKEMPTAFDRWWSELLIGLDRSFQNQVAVSNVISKPILALSGINPLHMLRNSTFSITIPLRPVKQLALQWTTGLQLMGLDARATLSAFKDSTLVNYSLAAWDNPARWDKYVRPVARAYGYDPDEWLEIFTQFRKTGKAYSIDSNVMISEANFGWSRSMPSTALGRLGQAARNIAIAPVTLGKRLGFDLGELGNQSVSWLFARRQWIKNNPGKAWNGSQQSLDQISTLARNLSIDMTKTNLLPYQRGGLATLTQFMSINHKMGARLLGADPDFPLSWKTTPKFIGGMLVVYGAAGLGLQDLYEKIKLEEGLEIPEELDDVFYGGLSQYMFNKSFDFAFGEEIGTTKVAFSDSFSPAAGAITFAPELISEMFEGNFLEALEGPSRSTFDRVGRAADHIMTISGRKDYTTGQKLLLGAEAVISEFGSFSDRFNYNLAMSYKEKMDTYNVINRKGFVGVPTNQSELFAKMLFGLNLRSENELYNRLLPMQAEVSSGKADSDIQDDANRLKEWWWKNWLANPDDEAAFADSVRPVMNGMNGGGDRLYNQQVWKLARQQLRQEPDFNKFIMNIVRKHAILDSDTDMRKMRNIITGTKLLTDEDKKKNLRFLDDLELNMENARRVLEEEGDF